MIRSNITLNREYTVGKTDERLFGSFIEHIGRAVYGGIYEPEHPEADEAGFRKDVAEAVRALLDRGTDVAMPVLGDVSLFASSAYVAQLLEEEGCRCVRVPGVPSFCAAAARLGRSLTEMDLPVHIVPAGGFPLEEALDLPGTKVLMKSGRQLPGVIEALEKAGVLDRSALVENCGLPGERVAAPLKKGTESGYFSTIVVKE